MGECFFWYLSTWVVPDKGPVKMVVCVRARVWSLMCHLETNHSGVLKLVFFGGSKQPVQQN